MKFGLAIWVVGTNQELGSKPFYSDDSVVRGSCQFAVGDLIPNLLQARKGLDVSVAEVSPDAQCAP